MNKKDDTEPTTTDTTEDLNPPFVNEECGDTMWDGVLKENEKRANEIFTRKPEESSSQTPVQKGE